MKRVLTFLRSNSPLVGFLMACLVPMSWAAIEAIATRIGGGQTPSQTVWVRYATHLIFMFILFAPRNHHRLVRTPRLGWQIQRALMMLGMHVCFILAVYRVRVDNIWSIFWISPVVIMLVSKVLLKERPGPLAWITALVGIAGAIWILQPTGPIDPIGVLLVLGMGIFFSLYLVETRWLRDEDTYASLFYTAAGVLVPLSFALPWFWRPLTVQGIIAMVLIGIVGYVLLYAIERALEILPASLVAPFMVLEPIAYHWMRLIFNREPIVLSDTLASIAVVGLAAILILREMKLIPGLSQTHTSHHKPV